MKRAIVWGDLPPQTSEGEWELLGLPAGTPPAQVAAAVQAQGADLVVVSAAVDPGAARALRRAIPHTPFLLAPNTAAYGPLEGWNPALRGPIDAQHLAMASLRRQERAPVPAPIVFFSPRGGCGTTTVLAAVAVQWSQWQEEAVLVDLNLHHPDLADVLCVPDTGSQPSLEAFLEARYSPVTAPDRPTLRLVPGLRGLENLGAVTVEAVHGLFADLQSKRLLVDTGACLSDPATYAALRAAGIVVLVMDGRRSTRRHVQRYRRTMLQLGLPWKDYLLVLNRFPNGYPLTPRELGEEVGLEPSITLPEVPEMERRGVAGAPGRKFHEGIERLAALLLGRPAPPRRYPFPRRVPAKPPTPGAAPPL